MVDLRSDTISMPTRDMLETILEAKLGDDGRTDSKGRGEDLAVNELEDLAAEMTGKEAVSYTHLDVYKRQHHSSSYTSLHSLFYRKGNAGCTL